MDIRERVQELQDEVNRTQERINETEKEVRAEFKEEIDAVDKRMNEIDELQRALEDELDELYEKSEELEEKEYETIAERTEWDQQQLREVKRDLSEASAQLKKESLYESLATFSLLFQKTHWAKQSQRSYNYSKRCYTLTYWHAKKIDHDGHKLNATLQPKGRNEWQLIFSVNRYSHQNNIVFKGTEKEAKAWCKKEVERRLLEIKKKLHKELAKRKTH